MPDVRFCRSCVVSNQRGVACKEYQRFAGSEPAKIHFDSEGVCAACRFVESRANVDWAEKEKALQTLLQKYRHDDDDPRPDVIVGVSGGKDSTYTSHVLKYKYGMHPLTVTWSPQDQTEVGYRNFLSLLEGGFDNVRVTPNPLVHKRLTRAAFETMAHPFQPFIMGQRSLAPRLAAMFGIGLVMFGEPDDFYEGEGSSWQESNDSVPFKDMYIGGVSYEEWTQQRGLTEHDLWLYLPPQPGAQVECRALGNYLPWRPQDMYYFAASKGFEANPQRTEGSFTRFSSIDDWVDMIHYYGTYVRWGIGRATHDASHEIRNGHMTRDEGVALVHKYDGELTEPTVQRFCSYTGLTETEFFETIDRYRKARPWLWHKEGNQWLLRCRVA